MTNAVILHSDSRESINKAYNFKQAAIKRGLIPLLFCPGNHVNEQLNELGSYRYYASSIKHLSKVLIDLLRNTKIDVIVNCSDSLTWNAVELGIHHKLISKASILPLLSKCAGYDLFNTCNFNTLKYKPLNKYTDIIDAEFKCNIFVKPDWSSGVHSISKYGYKKFNSTKEFFDTITTDLASFNRDSANPYAKLMMMENVEHEGVYCISAILREDKVFCYGHSYMKISGDDCFYDYVVYEDIGNTKLLEPLISKLWENGFRSNFLYLQCLMKDGKLYPMDINTRLSTYLDTLATHYDPEFYGRVLDFIMNKNDNISFKLPAPKVLIARVRSDPHKPIKSIKYTPMKNVTPLNFDRLSISSAGYDKAYSWPTYVCMGNTLDEVMDLYNKFKCSVSIEQ